MVFLEILRHSHENTDARVTLLKKRHWHMCFSVNFVKLLRAPFLQNTSGWLLLENKHYGWRFCLRIKTNDTVISTLHNISSRHYVLQEKEGIEKWSEIYLDLTKARLDLLVKVSKYVSSFFNVGFVYTDINCQLKIHFSNNTESCFDSIYDLISKTEDFPDDVLFFLSDSTVIFTSFLF